MLTTNPLSYKHYFVAIKGRSTLVYVVAKKPILAVNTVIQEYDVLFSDIERVYEATEPYNFQPQRF